MGFVISAPRSGSTWLMRALSHHPDVFATEQRLFGQFFEVWPNNNEVNRPRITADEYARCFASHYNYESLGKDRKEFVQDFTKWLVESLAEFARSQSKKQYLVDKITPYPNTTAIVRNRIQRFFPESKTVRLIRDGRDVVTSSMFDWLGRTPSQEPRYRRFVNQEKDVIVPRLFDDDSLRRSATLWNEVSQMPLQDAMTLRYEMMHEDHAGQLERVFDFLDVSSDRRIAEACADETTFEKTTGRDRGDAAPLEKARKGIVGDWRNWFTRRDGILMEELAGEGLRANGYVDDEKWIEELPDSLPIHID